MQRKFKIVIALIMINLFFKAYVESGNQELPTGYLSAGIIIEIMEVFEFDYNEVTVANAYVRLLNTLENWYAVPFGN